MRKMKPSGVEWIGDIPQEWSKDKVVRVFSVVGSGTTPKSNNESHYDGELNWIQSGDINGEILTNVKNHLSHDTIKEYSALKIYTAPFIVLAMYGASIGNTSISIIDGCVNQACCVLGQSRLDIKYAFYSVKSAKIFLIRKSVGGGQPNISQDIVKSLWLPVPPLSEQKRIAEFLDRKCAEIDSIISKTKVTIEQYKALKQSVITQAVTKGIRPDQPMKDSGIEWIGEIPQEWSVVKMKHLGRCRNGLTYSPENVVDEERGTLVLRSSNIKDGKLIFSDNVFVNNDIREELMVKQGDILICSRNGSRSLIGKNAIIPKELVATFGAFMMVFRCDTPEYVRYILSSDIFSYYLGTFLTSTINQLTADNFNNMQVVYCQDEAEQAEIISFLDRKCAEIDRLIAAKEQLLTELESYKKSVIYEYVTGKKEA